MSKEQTTATPRVAPTGSHCSGASGPQRLLGPSHTNDPSCPSLLPPLLSLGVALITESASWRTRLPLEGRANQDDCRSGPGPWTEPGGRIGLDSASQDKVGAVSGAPTFSEEVMVEMRRAAASHAQGLGEGKPGGVGGRSVAEGEKGGTVAGEQG